MATTWARYPRPAPPYSSPTVIPRSPRSPSLPQRSAGKTLSRSMSAARGAISSAAKARTVSRNMSIVSPRSKFNPEVMAGRSLAQTLGPFAVAALSASRHSDRTLATAPDGRAASIVAHRVQERLRLSLALEDVGAHGPGEHLSELHPHEGARRVAGDA